MLIQAPDHAVDLPASPIARARYHGGADAPALTVRCPMLQRRRRHRPQRAAHADAAPGLLHDRLLHPAGEGSMSNRLTQVLQEDIHRALLQLPNCSLEGIPPCLTLKTCRQQIAGSATAGFRAERRSATWAPCSGATLSRGRFSSKTRRRWAATCLRPSARPAQQVLTPATSSPSAAAGPRSADLECMVVMRELCGAGSGPQCSLDVYVLSNRACCQQMVMLLRQGRRSMRS